MERSTAWPVTGGSPAPSSRLTAAPTPGASTWPAAPRTPGRGCRWSSGRDGSRPTPSLGTRSSTPRRETSPASPPSTGGHSCGYPATNDSEVARPLTLTLQALPSWYASRHVARPAFPQKRRLHRPGPMPELPRGPGVVVLNHPFVVGPVGSASYLDRGSCLPGESITANRGGGTRRSNITSHGPLGFFGIETGTVAGTRRFLLADSLAIHGPARVRSLWLTAEGRLRRRPTSPHRPRGPASGIWPSRLSGCGHRADGDRVPVLGRSVPGGPGPIRIVPSEVRSAETKRSAPGMDGINRDGDDAGDARWSGRGVHVSRPWLSSRPSGGRDGRGSAASMISVVGCGPGSVGRPSRAEHASRSATRLGTGPGLTQGAMGSRRRAEVPGDELYCEPMLKPIPSVIVLGVDQR